MTKRVVIFRLGSLGDTIVALPCFHRIVSSFPDHERVALTNIPVSSKAPSLESILGPGGFIHSSIAYPLGLRRPQALFDLALKLRRLKADTLVYLGGDRGLRAVYRDLLYFRACGFRRIIGAPVRRDLDRVRLDPATGEVEREAERLARCMAPLGPIDLDDPAAWDLKLTSAERATARQALAPLSGRNFIAVNTGGKLPANDWGLENWSALFGTLAGRHAQAVAFVGAAEDSERASRLGALWRGPTLDLCGKLSPRESSAVLEQADMFVGHDSGPLHLAWTRGTPCVGLFGSHNPPNKWHPIGPQHITIQVASDVRYMPVDRVAEAVETVLVRNAGRAASASALLA